MPTSELVKVSVTPQGTADVYIGELHIKTFGGPVAHQAASDFAAAIRNEMSKATVAVGDSFKFKYVPTDEILGDKADAYKLETRKPRQ